MSAVTLRDLPPDLHEFLKADAAANHRSFNKQVIVALDAYRASCTEQPKPKLTPKQKIARTREIQAQIRAEMIHDPRTDDEILGYDENGLPT
jgi:plasmid stability protein